MFSPRTGRIAAWNLTAGRVDSGAIARILCVQTNCDYLAHLQGSSEFQQGCASHTFLPRPAPTAPALALWIHEHAARSRKMLPSVGAYRNNPPRQALVRRNGQDWDAHSLHVETDGIAGTWQFHSDAPHYLVSSAAAHFTSSTPAASGAHAAISPVPAQVPRVLVEPGALVRVGDPLSVLEAVKMEQTIKSQKGRRR